MYDAGKARAPNWFRDRRPASRHAFLSGFRDEHTSALRNVSCVLINHCRAKHGVGKNTNKNIFDQLLYLYMYHATMLYFAEI